VRCSTQANSGTTSHSLRRSSSARSLSLKRVCSAASADTLNLSPFSALCLWSPGGSQVPGGGNSHAAAAAAAAAKRSSLGQSSSGQAIGVAAAPAGRPARGPRVRLGGRLLSPEEAQKHLQAVAAAAASATACKSLSRAQSPSVCLDACSPAGPAALAAAAVDCSTSFSTGGGSGRPPSFGMGRAGSITSSLAGRHSSGSGSLTHTSAGCFNAAANAAAAAVAAQQKQQHVLLMSGAAAAACVASMADAEGALPEGFIPTPEQAERAWPSLASTLDSDPGSLAAAPGSLAAPDSYAALLQGPPQRQQQQAGGRAHAPVFVSAFAPAACLPVPLPVAAPLQPGMVRASALGGVARSCLGMDGAGAVASSAPVAISHHRGGRGAWGGGSACARSSSLAAVESLSGSSSYTGHATLAHSLEPLAASLPAHLAGGGCGEVAFGAGAAHAAAPAAPAAGPDAAIDAELSRLLNTWAPQEVPALLAPVAVHGAASSSNLAALPGLGSPAPAPGSAPLSASLGRAASAGAPAAQWRPAFAPSAFSPVPGSKALDASAAATTASGAAGMMAGCGMMPTPGLQPGVRGAALAPAAAAAGGGAAGSGSSGSGGASLPTTLRIKTTISKGRGGSRQQAHPAKAAGSQGSSRGSQPRQQLPTQQQAASARGVAAPEQTQRAGQAALAQLQAARGAAAAAAAAAALAARGAARQGGGADGCADMLDGDALALLPVVDDILPSLQDLLNDSC
jgi:hypothetical protein